MNLMKKNRFIVLLAFAATALLQSCFEPKLDTPEKLLQHYIYIAFAGSEDKELEQHLTPEFLKKIKD